MGPIVLACLLLALPALVPSAPALPNAVALVPSDTVRGTVVDSGGAPVVRAQVSLLELGRRTLTDAQGRFALGRVPPGRYTLVATGPGYPWVARLVTVPVTEALVVRLTGEPSLLPPVTVTATRSPLDPRLSPLPATELSGDVLRRSTSVSLARAVEELPGLRTLSTGEQIGKPVIRGLSGARVLVLDNGLRLEDYSWSDEDGPSVDARLADRVEVIRGPASVLYGSDAVGGVINVLPADLPRADAGSTVSRFRSEIFGASNNVEGGVLLGFEGAKGGLGARATVIGRTAGDLHTPAGELDNTGFSAANGEVAVGASGTNGGASLRYSRYGGEFKLLEAGGPGAEGTPEEDGGPERKLSDDRVRLDATRVLGAVRLEARAQWQRHWIAENSDEAPAPGGGTEEGRVFDLLLNTGTLDLLLHHRLGSRVTGTVGLSGVIQDNDSRGPEALIPDARTRDGAVFALERADVGRWSLLAGARVDVRGLDADANADLALPATSRHYTAATGDVGLVFRAAPSLFLTANAGRAFRAPNLFELFANGPRLGEARFEIGDSTLGPETSFNLDVGLRWEGHGVRAELAAFRNRIGDYIFGVPTTEFQDSLRIFRYGSTDATLLGGEARVIVAPVPHLTLGGQVEYVRGTDAQDRPLPDIPPVRGLLETELGDLAFGWLEQARIGLELELVGGQHRVPSYDLAGSGATVFDLPTDGYALLGFEVGGEHTVGGRRLMLAARVRNLTNTQYRDYLSRYKTFAYNPGRDVSVRVGLEL
jgi:iron complex outermembrane recepter protein